MIKDESGAIAIITAVVLAFVLIGVAALAVDIGKVATTKNELQNAADAGALAGAGALYNDDGKVNVGANAIAIQAVEQNLAANEEIEIVSVKRGHWSFKNEEFRANEGTTDPVDLWDFTEEQLDDPDTPPYDNFINAVKVVTRKNVNNFFRRQSSNVTAEAVAYLGFTGTLDPFEVDQPIAICNTAIVDDDGGYTCNYGRMLHSGQAEGGETAAWTDFNQDDSPCEGGTSANKLRSLYNYGCSAMNPVPIKFGVDMATTHGVTTSVYKEFMDCWEQHINANGYIPWKITLPVIDCDDGFPTTCAKPIGAVTVNVMWVTPEGVGQIEYPSEMKEVPQYNDWTKDPGDSDEEVWSDFVDHFNLVDADSILHKTIYFLPDCDEHKIKGDTGGKNYGVLAKIPKLVD